MNKQDKLMYCIEIAFSQTTMPHIDEVYGDELCKIECIESLGTEIWQQTKLNDLICTVTDSPADIVEIIVCLTDKGFLYYLPAFLRFMIVSYDKIDVMGGVVINRLTPRLNAMDVPRASWVKNIYDCLTEQQRRCIQKVLFYLWETYDDGLVDEALNNYWFEHPELAEI